MFNWFSKITKTRFSLILLVVFICNIFAPTFLVLNLNAQAKGSFTADNYKEYLKSTYTGLDSAGIDSIQDSQKILNCLNDPTDSALSRRSRQDPNQVSQYEQKCAKEAIARSVRDVKVQKKYECAEDKDKDGKTVLGKDGNCEKPPDGCSVTTFFTWSCLLSILNDFFKWVFYAINYLSF
jgi:hypothetical protein